MRFGFPIFAKTRGEAMFALDRSRYRIGQFYPAIIDQVGEQADTAHRDPGIGQYCVECGHDPLEPHASFGRGSVDAVGGNPCWPR